MTIFPMEAVGQQIAVNVPLFLRKLWKMVNDQEAEDVIGWNSTGDGFLIYDQFRFITKLLPKYFKHNNMASFIRQLNFYDFHKVAGIDKDEIQFTHSCFLKDLPETLVFIRRKCTSLRSKLINNVKEEEISELLSGVKDLKTKHSLVDNELKLLKQENAALWNEVNNLRLKHAKQTKIINKIIHFLISYMHSHQSSLNKGKVPVGRRSAQNLKTGPTLLEIDYSDSNSDLKHTKETSYTVTESGTNTAITYPSSETESHSNIQPAERTLDEILNKVSGHISNTRELDNLVKVNASVASSSKSSPMDLPRDMLVNPKFKLESNLGVDDGGYKTALQNVKATVYNSALRKKVSQNPLKINILQNPKENLGLYLDNTQVEINSLQDILNNLSTAELTSFCNLMEQSDMESLEESSVGTDHQNVDQEETVEPTDNQCVDQEEVVEPTDNSEDDFELPKDEYFKNELVDQFDTLPGETNALNNMFNQNQEQFNDENLQNIEPEDLIEEYFSI